MLLCIILSAPIHGFQASEASLAAFAKRYAAAAASTTKSGVRLDLERIEAEAVGVTAAREADGEHSQPGGNSEETSEESSEESSEDESEESSSSDDSSSSSGEEESSSEEEEGETEDDGDELDNNGREEATEYKVVTTTPHAKEPNATAAPREKQALDGTQGAIIANDLTVPTEEAPGAAVGACDQDRAEETPGSGSIGGGSGSGSGSVSGSGSGSVRAGSRVERSSDLLDLESRVDNGAGKAASVVTSRLSSLTLAKPRGPLDSVAKGEQPSDTSEGSGGVGAGDGRRKNLIQEL